MKDRIIELFGEKVWRLIQNTPESKRVISEAIRRQSVKDIVLFHNEDRWKAFYDSEKKEISINTYYMWAPAYIVISLTHEFYHSLQDWSGMTLTKLIDHEIDAYRSEFRALSQLPKSSRNEKNLHWSLKKFRRHKSSWVYDLAEYHTLIRVQDIAAPLSIPEPSFV